MKKHYKYALYNFLFLLFLAVGFFIYAQIVGSISGRFLGSAIGAATDFYAVAFLMTTISIIKDWHVRMLAPFLSAICITVIVNLVNDNSLMRAFFERWFAYAVISLLVMMTYFLLKGFYESK